MLGGADPRLVKLLDPWLDLNLVDAPQPLGTGPLTEKRGTFCICMDAVQPQSKSKMIHSFYADQMPVFAIGYVITALTCHLFKDTSNSLVK